MKVATLIWLKNQPRIFYKVRIKTFFQKWNITIERQVDDGDDEIWNVVTFTFIFVCLL